jgi:hypothetical protein
LKQYVYYKPLKIIAQGIEKPFPVGIFKKNLPEILKAGKFPAYKLLPVEKTVEQGNKQGNQNKYKDKKEAWCYKKNNPQAFPQIFAIHARTFPYYNVVFAQWSKPKGPERLLVKSLKPRTGFPREKERRPF